MTVSVITRTRDRPLLLPRALDSLSSQTSREMEWVIVNDGGEAGPVDAMAEEARTRGIETSVIHHEHSRGMEAASNAGIARAGRPLLLIHDDDDTLEPTFLERTVGFLQDNDHYLGVVTLGNKVVERIEDDEIVELSRSVLNPRLESVDLALLAMRNQFPPISFLFSRHAYDAVGGFDESLPVLGDWDFNLRVLMQGDIGLIPQPLANHHHRYQVESGDEVYGNTVTTGVDRHLAWESRYRNRKLREDLAAGRAGLGHILSQGKQAEMLYRELENLRVAGDGWNTLMALSGKLGLHRLLKWARGD